MSQRIAASALLFALVGVACGSTQPITSCDPIGAATPLCGFQNPEDLALLPDGRVLVSEYGDAGAKPGRISLLDLASGAHESLYAGDGPPGPGPWGAADCEGPPSTAFSPHGIHLSTRPSGGLELLVVQHGGRESVEMFEVLPANGSWQLAWRGCAVAPEGGGLNDVVAVPEGGFLVTRFGPSSPASFMFAAAKATLFGGETGWVYAWTREDGFSEVPGTHAAGPNGIELSSDGAKIFLNTTLASEVLRIDRKSGAIEARAKVDRPDNLTWARDGRLRVASLRGKTRELLSCGSIESGSCPMPFAIVALDPTTMETKTVYEGGPGTPSGAGTVGLEVDGELLVGTFAGDRIVRVAAQGR